MKIKFDRTTQKIIDSAISSLKSTNDSLLEIVKKTNEAREKIAVQLTSMEMETTLKLKKITDNNEYKKVQEEYLDKRARKNQAWEIANAVYLHFQELHFKEFKKT